MGDYRSGGWAVIEVVDGRYMGGTSAIIKVRMQIDERLLNRHMGDCKGGFYGLNRHVIITVVDGQLTHGYMGGMWGIIDVGDRMQMGNRQAVDGRRWAIDGRQMGDKCAINVRQKGDTCAVEGR